ncbi:MAG: glycosyltransferase family 4 protein, partial [Elusimicrobiota bacterium]|nr:glycosyltransferase family 4 protein [Elusimicrobiota bacterium]
ISIYRYPMPPPTKGFLSYLWEFTYCWLMTFFLSIKILFKEGFDVIHACNPPDTFFLLGAFYKVLGKKFVFDQHDLCPEVYQARFGAAKKSLLIKGLLLLERLTYRTADLVIATNESYKKIAAERGRVKEEEIFVVRTGPDFQRFRRLKVEAALRKERKYMVCYLGVMGPQDGVDYLLRSVEFITRTNGRDDILFVLIGGGDSFNDLRKMSIDLGVQKHVLFTGRIPDEELIRYLSTADVCVGPDPKNELNDKSTMNKIMEYMAMAKPVVSFDLKEARFSAQEAALYARPNDTEDFANKILELLKDEKRRQQMGEYGRKRIEQELAWSHTDKELIKAYEKVFSN